MTERAEFIARIRREISRTEGLFPARPAERPADPAAAADLVRRQSAERWPEAVKRFQEEFEQLAGVFHVAPSLEAVPGVVGQIARERGLRRIVCWSPAALGARLDDGLRREGLDPVHAPDTAVDEQEAGRLRAVAAAAEIGLTGADLAIAETGTLVLVSGPDRPRSTSLLPEYHVAVFGPHVLVETLEQAGVVLEAWHADPARLAAGSAINFITGPSRTADIELTLTRGVHGPREVHAIFVDPRAGARGPAPDA